MTRAEQFILENQAAILSVLAVMCSDPSSARLALKRADVIGEQIEAWADVRSLPHDRENPYFKAS